MKYFLLLLFISTTIFSQTEKDTLTKKNQLNLLKLKSKILLEEMNESNFSLNALNYSNIFLDNYNFTNETKLATGFQLLSPLRLQYKSNQKYKTLYTILGTASTLTAIGVIGAHFEKYGKFNGLKRWVKRNFK